ncbi:hypothetical protein GBF38_014298 [Nibea albiflora]|uniref:Uncharacterized protein n=1 Tax=Nibea albiflora TaxID=240163 RepID=A0ACB7F7F7_NIBAL|nr:hypothetical protein GBF38_014298 [Nibea albiflora]
MACADVDMDIHGEDYDWTESQEGGWNEPQRGERREPHRRDGREADTDDWQEPRRGDGSEAPVVQHYQALEFVPDTKGPLHDLLQKQPAVLGFMVAGLVSNLLFKYPALLSVCLVINCSCIVVAVIAMILMCVDLIRSGLRNDPHSKMELFELCVLVLEVLLSAILCFWFSKEKRAKSP